MNIWPFASKVSTLRESRVLDGITDWHSHILPGVDDGFKEMEDSLKAIKLMEQLGVKHLWLTPHVMEDCPNETGALQRKFEELQLAYDGSVTLHLGSENMMDNLFEDRLEVNDFLPLGEKGTHLLVETSYYNPPMNMIGLLEQVKKKGYYPVLAHPERYQYMDEKDYQRLKEMGVLFQGNYFSLIGAYGSTAQKKLEWLFKKGMIDLLGSDLHRYKVLTHLIEKSPRKNAHLEAMRAVGQRTHIL